MRYITETKNLFDINSVSNLNNWVTKTTTDRPYAYYQFNLKPNTIYTFQRNYESQNNEVYACFSKKYGVADEQGFFIHPTAPSLTRKQLSFTTDNTGIMYLNVYRVTAVLSSFIELIEGAQLELGDTATPYVPYGYLPMYKGKYKVSNVCQVLDKRTYPASWTDRGITFTNNGDGSITVNGTATGSYYSLYTININIDSVIFGHKYAILGTGTNIQCVIIGNYAGGYIFKNSNSIYTFPKHEYTRIVYEIRVLLGFNFSNVIIKPQLFDLTEMYGAGNEPTTVEQFRQDFPEEMYEYTPYCWASMKNIRYIDTTKNLFDINKAKVNIQNDGSFIPTVGHTDHFYTMNVKAGETYTVSYYTTSFGSIGSGLNLSIQTGDFYRDGVQLFFRINQKKQYVYQKGSFTIPDGANKITFSSIMSSYYYNFMIELGDTATPYVPYGYLPLK